ncbi:MAG TPA: peroxiredoxin-like family protein [Chloroflexota bacterium]|jgi:peroxiredoxin|nr:peroxiredoxin-like family protein [Chloroflexota bacterium]
MNRTDTPIADQVAALHQQGAGQLPPDVAAVFGAELARLAVATVPDRVARVGTVMPDGDLFDAYGHPTTLMQARAGRPAVVVFYRGAWCPYCNLTLQTYQDVLVTALDARGIALIAISPQKPDGSLSMQEKNALTYTVLSDPGNQIAGQLGILTTPGEDVRDAQAALGLDLTAVNADGTHTIPMPTVVIVDAAGTIRWIDVHPNYTTRTEPGDILAALATTIGQA